MRDRIIALVSAVVVLGAVGAAFWFVTARSEPDPQAEAEAAIDAYLAAWETGDTATMEAMVEHSTAELRASHTDLVEALRPTDLRVSRGTVTLEGAQADTDLAVEVDLPDADTASWSSHLTAQRLDGTWTIIWDPTVIHPDLRASYTWSVVEEEAQRAEIRAHDGTALTAPGEVITVGIEPRRLEDPDALLADVAALLPEAEGELAELLQREDLRPTWFYPVVTLRPDRWESVARDVRPLPGIVLRTEQARVGSDDGFALHTLGRVGPADDELAERQHVEPGTEVGLYGLEAIFDDRLTGTPAFEVVLRAPDGDIVTTVHRYQGDAPEPVTTTLDTDVQRAVENALVGVDDPVGIVVVDAPTGAIRAVASRPLAGFNRALAGRYPPGSTFKIVTASALLTAGTAPSDPVECPGEVIIGGLQLRNAHGLALGTTAFDEAFARSCNTTFAGLGTDLEPGAVAAAARRFGFGTDYTLPLNVFGGSYPEPRDLAERAAAAIGQARVEASPLHMATVAAAVASGSWQPPHLLVDGAAGEPADDRTADGDAQGDDPAGSGDAAGDDPAGADVAGNDSDDGRDAHDDAATRLAAAVRDDLTAMMRGVVTRGTGTAAQVAGDPPVVGKTGSAEFGDDDPPRTHAWFVGSRGDVAFAVLVEGGGEGGEVAAPIAARLLRELEALVG